MKHFILFSLLLISVFFVSSKAECFSLEFHHSEIESSTSTDTVELETSLSNDIRFPLFFTSIVFYNRVSEISAESFWGYALLKIIKSVLNFEIRTGLSPPLSL